TKGRKVLLEDPQVKYQLPLIEKTDISHDTRNLRFGLPSKDHVLGLPIGQHIHISARINEQMIIRSYTPVSSDDDRRLCGSGRQGLLQEGPPQVPQRGNNDAASAIPSMFGDRPGGSSTPARGRFL
ncbi:hypothetical protein YQE_01144, partial [Dendroctonus ponderosae]